MNALDEQPIKKK